MDCSQRKTQWFRFSLRAVLAILVFAGVGMSFLTTKMRTAKKQTNVVKLLESRGCQVDYEDRCYMGFSPPEAWVPNLARRIFGNDFFFNVRSVYAWHNNFGDDDASHLKELITLRCLELKRTQLTDDGLRHLAGMTELRVLMLDETSITDAGLERLEELSNLYQLSLRGTRVTDSGLLHLKSLARLERLDLRNTKVSNAGVAALKEALPNLWVDPPKLLMRRIGG